MNKADLMQLKRSFDNSKRYSQYIGGDGSLYQNLTEQQILSLVDSDEAVNASIGILKSMILFLSNNDVSYNGIAIYPVFSVFVDNDYVDEDGNIINKKAILNDYIGISFDKGYVYSKRTHSEVFQITDFEECQDVYYGRFSDFVIALNEAGFDLEGISSFEDIRKLTYEDKKPFGKIAVSFNKKSSYIKKKN